jgi:RNA polymerase sigma factor (TIGR02999 family)
MRSERREHTFQATALVHEAYVRLVGSNAGAGDRAHFLGLAAQAMRRILVDSARGRRAAKRGGPHVRVTLAEVDAALPGSADKVIELDEALNRLQALDPRKQRALELRIFGGLTHAEIAQALEVSIPTVERDLRMARAWLRAELAR